jgi:hypothetical protein
LASSCRQSGLRHRMKRDARDRSLDPVNDDAHIAPVEPDELSKQVAHYDDAATTRQADLHRVSPRFGGRRRNALSTALFAQIQNLDASLAERSRQCACASVAHSSVSHHDHHGPLLSPRYRHAALRLAPADAVRSLQLALGRPGVTPTRTVPLARREAPVVTGLGLHPFEATLADVPMTNPERASRLELGELDATSCLGSTKPLHFTPRNPP